MNSTKNWAVGGGIVLCMILASTGCSTSDDGAAVNDGAAGMSATIGAGGTQAAAGSGGANSQAGTAGSPGTAGAIGVAGAADTPASSSSGGTAGTGSGGRPARGAAPRADGGGAAGNASLPKHWHESKGFATDTEGGLAGEVYRVTNLDNSGPGSFRDAVSASNRLVVFEVGGTIDLKEQKLIIGGDISNLTIAGQTAPFPGITLFRGNFSVDGKDIVVSHINIRLGIVKKEADTSNITGDNVVFDHLSAAWARDEVLSLHRVNNVTLYKCIIAEGLAYTGHEDGEHSKGSLINQLPEKLSLIGNLYAHNALRNPRVKEGEIFIANHIVYDWAPGWDHSGPKWSPGMVPNEHAFNVVVSARLGTNVTMVGSVGIQGPDSVGEYFLAGHYGKPSSANAYVDDNIIINPAGDDLVIVDTETIDLLDAPAVWPEGMVPMPAHEALYEGLRTVGPRPGNRDFHNDRIVRTVADGNGEVIDSPDEVGGFPKEDNSTRPIEVPDGAAARQDWLDGLEDEFAVDRKLDLSRLYGLVGSAASDKLR